MALALRAGAPLKDIEFFQTHPTGVPNGILITEGARGEGGYLINRLGERFMSKYAPKFMELAPRDLVARSIHTEIVEGRGFEDGCVRLDLRHLGAEKIKERLPQIREIAMYFAGVDPIEQPIPIRPTVHYTMGGIHVNVDCATPVKGVFAAGEAACVSVHGANRLGGNSLLETIVYGLRAARTIPTSLDGAKSAPEPAIERELAKFNALFADAIGEDVPALRADLEKAMVAGFSLKREAKSMAAGQREVAELVERFKGVRVRERNLVFNVELVRALELGCMIDVAHACASAALPREESRGGHFRYDFPKLDNQNFLKHSLVTRDEAGGLQLDWLPVTIVDTQPLDEITY
jgi:succinate dehydrogenase / fumarate reductase flavoprotein subunit